MYLILKYTNSAQEVKEKMSKLDPSLIVNNTTYAFTIKAPNIGGTAQVSERRIRAWKRGEPNNEIYIDFKDVITILEL